MNIEDYPSIRAKLVRLYERITTKGYHFILPRELTLTDEQIEGRYQFDRVGLERDNFFFTRPVDMVLTIEDLVPIMPRLQSPDSVGFRNPRDDSIEIYETIQEYVYLWTVIIKYYPNYQSPTIRELYALESVSSWIFPIFSYYKKQIYLENNDYKEDANDIDNIGALINVIINNNFISKEDSEENSFVSHTDKLLEDKPSLKVDYDNWLLGG